MVGMKLADNIVELHGERELRQMLNQFFNCAVYYGILGYDERGRKAEPKSDLQESKTWPYQLA